VQTASDPTSCNETANRLDRTAFGIYRAFIKLVSAVCEINNPEKNEIANATLTHTEGHEIMHAQKRYRLILHIGRNSRVIHTNFGDDRLRGLELRDQISPIFNKNASSSFKHLAHYRGQR